jgi:hypothetical protein
MTDTPKPLKEWALYVYFSADVPEAGSRACAIRGLVQMAGVGSSPRVHVAAQMNLPGKVTRRYILPEVSAGAGPLTISPTVSGTSFDLRSLTDFIKWSADACPAEKTMLVLWGHGFGIDDFSPPGLHTRTQRQGIQALEMVAPATRTTTKTDLIAQLASLSPEPVSPNLMQAFSLLPQFSFGTNPTNAQVAASIEAAFPSLPGGRKPAILGMASCEMAMAEAWCELADCAEIGLASQTPVPYKDWPVGPILKGLEAHPEADAKTAAKMISEAFVQSFAGEKDAYVAISTVELSLIGSLTAAIKPLALALTEAASTPEGMENIFEARNHCPIYDPDGFIDLRSFCEFLKITLPKPDVSAACDRAIETLKEFVVDSDYSPMDPTIKLSQSTGLSVWFPSWIQFPSVKMMEKKRSIAYLRKGYPETRFALSTGWNKFLVTIRDAAAETRRRHAPVGSS